MAKSRGPFYQMPKYAKAFQSYTSRRFGRQDHTALAGPDALRLSQQRTIQRHTNLKKKAGDLPDYQVGVDAKVTTHHAPTRFGFHLISIDIDETRGRQELVRQGVTITGDQWSPDCCEWVPENRCYVPELKEELINMLILHRDLQLLSSDISTHQFRSLTDRHMPSLTFGIIPIASKGNSAFQTLKYWMATFNALHSAGLNVRAVVADHCAASLCGGKMLNKPSQEFVDFGCSYINLPVDDMKYFALYCEPAPTVVKHVRTHEAVPTPRPISKQFLPDNPHLQRLFMNNIDALAFLPLYSAKTDSVQGSLVASYGCLRERAANRIGDGMKLSEVVNINKYAEFRNDAAYALSHQDVIDLLTPHHPEDKATILAMQAMHFLAEVYRNKSFTNCRLAVWYVSATAELWGMSRKFCNSRGQLIAYHHINSVLVLRWRQTLRSTTLSNFTWIASLVALIGANAL